MKQASVILFFQAEPVGYRILQKGTYLLLQPNLFQQRNFIPPVIRVMLHKDGCQVQGTRDKSIIEQVQRSIFVL